MAAPLRILKNTMQRRWRRARMRAMVAALLPQPGWRVLDLGGAPDLWDHVDLPLDVTLLNTPRACARLADAAAARGCKLMAGDACDLRAFADGAFDLVFSNSVIEHVGARERVARFAAEVRRVGRAYWVQTPCHTFPIESHTGLPWFWYYPAPLRRRLIAWFDRPAARDSRPDPVGETTWFRLAELRQLFPDGEVFRERSCGLVKSWSLYRCAQG